MEGKDEARETKKHVNPFHKVYETFIKECKIVVTQAGNGFQLSFGHSILMDNIVLDVEQPAGIVIEQPAESAIEMPQSNTCRELVIYTYRDGEKTQKEVAMQDEEIGKELKEVKPSVQQHLATPAPVPLAKPAPVEERFVFSDFGLVCPTCDTVRCDSCGQFHLTLRCPARGRRCEKCGDLNHFKYRCGSGV